MVRCELRESRGGTRERQRGRPAWTKGQNISECSTRESQNQLRRCLYRKLIERKTFYRSWNLSVAIDNMLSALIDFIERRREERPDLAEPRRPGTPAPPPPL